VVELGAGTGLCALAVLAASPKAEVTATDVSIKGLRYIRAAAAEMALELHGADVYDVCGDAPLPPCDLLLACEMLYTPELAVGMARCCAEAVRRGAHVLVGCSGRPARQHFLDALAADGLPGAAFEHAALQPSGGASYATSFVEWLRDEQPGLRLVHVQDDARLFGLASWPAMC